MKKLLVVSLLLASASMLVACEDEDDPTEGAEATAKFYTYGEPFIEDGIPAEEFKDGWAVTFDEFVITLQAVGLEGGDAWSGDANTAMYVDVAQSGDDADNPGHEVGTVTIMTNENYDTAFYSIAPATVGTNVNVDSETIEDLQQSGASVLVRGTATKGEESVDFDWTFDTDTAYNPCEIEEFSPEAAEDVRVELTIHGDHLVYDSFDEDPELGFQPYADADANEDGVITNDELDSVDVVETDFDASGVEGVTTLLDYAALQSRTLGHINGEGHCDTD